MTSKACRWPIFKTAGNAGVKAMPVLCDNTFLKGNVLFDWELSIVVLICKEESNLLNCGFKITWA